MSSISQFDPHPDADALNGFIEQELAEAERAQVLDHLASCGRCRQIVYLSQDAAMSTAAHAPVAAIVKPPESHSRRRWSSRQFLWAPAAAFALLVVVAFVFYPRQSGRATDLAQNSASPAPITGANPASLPPSSSPQPSNPIGPESPPRSAARGSLASPSPAFATAGAGSAPHASVHSPAASPIVSSMNADSISAANVQSESMQQSPPSRQLATQNPNASAAHGGLFAPRQAQLPGFAGALRGEKTPMGLTDAQSKKESAITPADEDDKLAAAQAQFSPAPPQLSPEQPAPEKRALLKSAAPLPQSSAIAPGNSGLPMLPGGLPVVSTVAAGRTTLAIDAIGSLFLSHDLGATWERVPHQWTGRATRVRMAQSPAASAQPAGAGKPSSPAAIAPVVLFEIVNDGNAVWSSADGKTWTPKASVPN